MLVIALAAALLRGPERARAAPQVLAAEPGRLAAADLDLGAPDSLWDGSDAPAVQLNVSHRSAGGHPKLHVLGLFNTGTNLLYDLLDRNFPPLDLQPWQQGEVQDGGLAWKHAKPSVYFGLHPAERPAGGDVLLAIIRDPMSWLQSMRKAPYDLQGCTAGPAWATQPCSISCAWTQQSCLEAHAGPQQFSSIAEVWNAYTADYDAAARYGYRSVVVVRYEDLVRQPEVELGRIGAALALRPHGAVVHQHAPAKAHGMSVGRQQALAKLQSKSYLSLYANGDRGKACDRLHQPTMLAHNYADCTGW